MTLELGELTAGSTIILKLCVLMNWCQFTRKENSRGGVGIFMVSPTQCQLQWREDKYRKFIIVFTGEPKKMCIGYPG